MKKKFENPTASEIIFTADQQIEAIELNHHHLKFTVTNLDNRKPLSHYINPTIIKKYMEKEDL